MGKCRYYIVFGGDSIEDAEMCMSKAEAVSSFKSVALDLDRFGQQIEASIHLAPSRSAIVEYPDYILSLGPRGGVRCTPVF